MRKTEREKDAMADEYYDAIVIGTSQGGRFLPVELAKAGQKVALVERDQLGGACVNTGCTPTKTMVASARLDYQARRDAEYAVRVGPVSVDLAAVRERKRAMVAGARENYASRLTQDGLDLIEGDAHFTCWPGNPGTFHRCPRSGARSTSRWPRCRRTTGNWNAPGSGLSSHCLNSRLSNSRCTAAWSASSRKPTAAGPDTTRTTSNCASFSVHSRGR